MGSSQHLAVIGEDAIKLALHIGHLSVDDRAQTSVGANDLGGVMQQVNKLALYMPKPIIMSMTQFSPLK